MSELAFDFLDDRVVSVQHSIEQIEEGQRNESINRLQFHEAIELRLVQVIGQLHQKRVQLEVVVLDSEAVVPVLGEARKLDGDRINSDRTRKFRTFSTIFKFYDLINRNET